MKNKKIITYTFIIVLIFLSFLPVFYLFSYCFATGDDYGYSAVVKYVWNDTHSFLEIVKASLSQIIGVYHSWQGTWYSVFLFAFNPEIFGFGYYILTPMIMFSLHVLSAYFLIKTFFESKYCFNKIESLLVLSLLVFCTIQFAPSYQCNLFWWVGTVHYVVPYFTGCLALYNSREYLKTYHSRNIVLSIITFTLIGGGNYQIAVITPLILVCIILWDKIIIKCTYKIKAALLALPVTLEMVGLIISMIAPGNKNRGGDNFGFSVGYAVKIILECFITAFNTIFQYLTQRTILFAVFLIYGIVSFYIIKNKKISKENYKSPILMIIMTFCLFAASFAPALYANVGVSGGVFNTNFYVFVIVVFYDISYLESYCISHTQIKLLDKSYIWSKVVIFSTFMILVYIGRHSLKLSTSYVSYSYIVSGQADDYKNQILLQYRILSNSDYSEPIVPFVNDEQGPLQHMPITDNPDAWTNTVTAKYYNKTSVRAIERDTWLNQYGKIYGY